MSVPFALPQGDAIGQVEAAVADAADRPANAVDDEQVAREQSTVAEQEMRAEETHLAPRHQVKLPEARIDF